MGLININLSQLQHKGSFGTGLISFGKTLTALDVQHVLKRLLVISNYLRI